MPDATPAPPDDCMPAAARQAQTGIALVLTAAVLALFLVRRPVSMGVQIAILAFSALVLGIPHGAMDHRVGEWVLHDRLRGRWAPVFVATYCGLALVMLLAWHVAPVGALVVFLALSSLHFGLGDVGASLKRVSVVSLVLLAFTRGVVQIGLPVIFHRGQVALLFGWLMPQHWGGSPLPMPVIYWAAVCLVVPSFLFHMSRAVLGKQWVEAGELGLLSLAGAVLPPLVGFAVYFGLWHSPRHLIDLACWRGRQSRGASRGDRPDGLCFKDGLRKVALEAVPLTLATLALMAIALGILMRSMSMDVSAVRVIFMSLAALTVPHMLLTAAAEHKAGAGPLP